MSVCFADRVEMAIRPYRDIDELLAELRRVPLPELRRMPRPGRIAPASQGPDYRIALTAAILALELLRDFLADEVEL